MKYRFNIQKLIEYFRRIGIVAVAGGVAHGVLDKCDLSSEIGMVIAGLIAIFLASLGGKEMSVAFYAVVVAVSVMIIVLFVARHYDDAERDQSQE